MSLTASVFQRALPRECQGFPAPEQWAKVLLNGDVSSSCRTWGCESSKLFTPWVQEGLHAAANEPVLSFLLKVSHSHISKSESALSLERMVRLLSSAESLVLCFVKQAARV